MTETTRETEFVALGHAGSEHYARLETFPSPGIATVSMTSDELVAVCPITRPAGLLHGLDRVPPEALCLESKSLKLYLATYRNEGVFCEALAVKIRDDVARARAPAEKVDRRADAEGARRDHDHRDEILGRLRRHRPDGDEVRGEEDDADHADDPREADRRRAGVRSGAARSRPGSSEIRTSSAPMSAVM